MGQGVGWIEGISARDPQPLADLCKSFLSGVARGAKAFVYRRGFAREILH